MEVGLHFSDTNILVLPSGDKHSTAQCKRSTEFEQQA